MVDIPDSEKVHASAAMLLIDENQEEAARILLSCNLIIDKYYHWIAEDEGFLMVWRLN